jgi:hypothetical protein
MSLWPRMAGRWHSADCAKLIVSLVALLATSALALSEVDHRVLCQELAAKGQLRAGMSVDQCIRQLAAAEASEAVHGVVVRQEPIADAPPSKPVQSADGFDWKWLLFISLPLGYVLVGIMWVRDVRKTPAPIVGDRLSIPQAWDLHVMTGPRIATAGRWSIFDYASQVALWPRLDYYSIRAQLAGFGKPQTIFAATLSVVLKRLSAETLCVAAVIALPRFWFTGDQFWLRYGTRLVAIVLWTPLTVVVGLIISPLFWIIHYGIELIWRLFAPSTTRH